MRKLSYRATEFLLSLGSPTKELRIEYRKHLAEMARMGPVEEIQTGIKASFYEELIELPLNAHFEYIHLLSSEEMCYVIHRRDPGQGETSFSTCQSPRRSGHATCSGRTSSTMTTMTTRTVTRNHIKCFQLF